MTLPDTTFLIDYFGGRECLGHLIENDPDVTTTPEPSILHGPGGILHSGRKVHSAGRNTHDEYIECMRL